MLIERFKNRKIVKANNSINSKCSQMKHFAGCEFKKKYQRKNPAIRYNVKSAVTELNGKFCYIACAPLTWPELNLYAAYKTEQGRIDNYQ